MSKTLGIGWVVVVGAAMLLVVAAACTETVEVPGETVVVEKVVTETVEVPGETVVVEKEVVKEVQVPGETVVKEVVKTVEVPGETVVVEKEVVKTVEVPGETVVKEVVKTVAGPERVVVKEVPGKQYVTDPTTGRVVEKPRYGGTLTSFFSTTDISTQLDPFKTWYATYRLGLVYNKLGTADWGVSRGVYDFRSLHVPFAALKGDLAESWSTPDPLTIVIKVREGVHWQDKAPVNGRELTAEDIEWNWHRILGLGSGFTETYLDSGGVKTVGIESVTATDENTVVFTLEKPNLGALSQMLTDARTQLLPPDVYEEYGNFDDWRNVVGTGAFILTNYVVGGAATFAKNPNYWAHDEKYPENSLPYIDEVRLLSKMELETQKAALRAGKIDYTGLATSTYISDLEWIDSLLQTNPEINIYPYSFRGNNGWTFNSQEPPFDDVKVRHALQMAIDWNAINQVYWKGFADTNYVSGLGRTNAEWIVPYEEWPDELQGYYRYDPEGAEKLLDDAGYPRGADGIRFKTKYNGYDHFDLDSRLLAIEYFKAIGIDVTDVYNLDRATLIAVTTDLSYDGLIYAVSNSDGNPLAMLVPPSKASRNTSNIHDPVYEQMMEAVNAATTIENRITKYKELQMYTLGQHWLIQGPREPVFQVAQPWIKGYNGEGVVGGTNDRHGAFSRIWIDQELKEAMGY